MSKLVWVNYRISDAEERQARRKIELLRRTLARCAVLRQQLSEFEPVAGEDWAMTLAKYEQMIDDSQWQELASEYNRLYDELPEVLERLEQGLAEARAKRTRLELTAATLAALGASPEETAFLAELAGKAESLSADRYAEAAGKVEAILRQRLDAPLVDREATPTARQLALAADCPEASGDSRTESIAVPTAPVPGRARTLRASADSPSESAHSIPRWAHSMTCSGACRSCPPPRPVTGHYCSTRSSLQPQSASARRDASVRSGSRRRGLAWLVSATLCRLTIIAGGSRLPQQPEIRQGARAARDDARRWSEEARRQDGARVRSAMLAGHSRSRLRGQCPGRLVGGRAHHGRPAERAQL
ncbi:MAG: hypothetical protein R3D33_13035 [Hyphomicrobiaceae bacterium]